MFAVKVQGVVVQTKSRTFVSHAIRFRRVTLDSCDDKSMSKATYTECETWSSLYTNSASARAERDEGE